MSEITAVPTTTHISQPSRSVHLPIQDPNGGGRQWTRHLFETGKADATITTIAKIFSFPPQVNKVL
jgi:hypothetical protein